MSKRINISISDDLENEIGNWRRFINISKVCQDAIFREIQNFKNKEKERNNVIDTIYAELERRRKLLISLAEKKVPVEQGDSLDETDREHILSYLKRNEIPPKPEDLQTVMKIYASSCLSFQVVRRQLTRLIGKIPTPDTIPECLAKIFNSDHFYDDRYWESSKILETMLMLQQKHGFSDTDLSSLKLKPRILAIMIDGSKMLSEKLKNGLRSFFDEISEAEQSGAESTWIFVQKTSKPLRHVGPALLCDFYKNMGFSNFVRVENHFKKEFPELLNTERLTVKRQFIMSLKLCDELKMKPFHFDHIMYQWGRNKKYLDQEGERHLLKKNTKSAAKMKTIEVPESIYNRLGGHVKGFDDTPAKVIERLLDYYEGVKKFGGDTSDDVDSGHSPVKGK